MIDVGVREQPVLRVEVFLVLLVGHLTERVCAFVLPGSYCILAFDSFVIRSEDTRGSSYDFFSK